ncbi:MAG TPA: VWA domain-containing protein [Planctomycetaceae bacterium]|nr:hypothetical protein [Blastopirellula sp.]HAY82638.1 VWA domain-containing protein [Planctomycetaceae bacterium]
MNLITRRTLCIVLAISVAGVTARGDGKAKPERQDAVKRKVQIAILLDNSGSMRGLIDQARSELWRVVNEFVGAKLGGVHPDLEVAVYHYGRPPATQLVPLTDDLDRVSEALFGIPVSGGSEYCGQVIQKATRELAWSDSNRDLKLIFIAGNEPFFQGPVDYRAACRDAIERDIVVNTIHCGHGIPSDWREAARLADGKAINIDHNEVAVHIESPQDKRIAELGIAVNKTYLAFGVEGQAAAMRQEAQDANAKKLSLSSSVQRGLAKANAYYKNARWDLCDACREGKVDLATIKAEQLPEVMRPMNLQQRRDYVKQMQEKRASIQKEINQLNVARKKYVAQEREKRKQQDGTAQTLDQAVITAIRSQAKGKDLVFPER